MEFLVRMHAVLNAYSETHVIRREAPDRACRRIVRAMRVCMWKDR